MSEERQKDATLFVSQLTSDINWGTAALFCESIQSCFTVNQHLFFTRDDIILQFTTVIR